MRKTDRPFVVYNGTPPLLVCKECTRIIVSLVDSAGNFMVQYKYDTLKGLGCLNNKNRKMVMGKNWKTKSWKDFSPSSKKWFFITVLYLFCSLGIIILGASYSIAWPRWMLVIWMIVGLYTAYKFASTVGMLDDDDDDYDDNPQILTR